MQQTRRYIRDGNDLTQYHYDGSGNVVGLSDAGQNSVAEYSYDAYGNTLSATGAQAALNTYRYSTKEYFGSVGLYNYGYRFYSPGMGRWINRDPIGEVGGFNLYAAFANSPTNLADAYGLATDPPGKAGRIRVVYNAFIPSSEVNAPGIDPGVPRVLGIVPHGDSRNASSTGGSYRVMHTVVINPSTGQAVSWEAPGTSKVTWPLIGDRGIKGWPDAMNTWVRGNSCDGWDITMRRNARNGYDFTGIGPGITYEINLHVTPDGRVTGNIVHDPYPAYEIWLYTGPANNATPVYQNYPASGTSVIGIGALLGP